MSKIEESLVIENATQWLASQLTSIDRDPHPHDLAAVAHSLQAAEAEAAEAAFQLLSKYRIEDGDTMFWGSEAGPRPNTGLPTTLACCQSLAVRATALALATYTRRGERLRGRAVTWLHARRLHHSGWGDAVTSALATRALVLHSLAQPARDTSLSVRLELVAEDGSRGRTKLLTLNSREPGPHVISDTWRGAAVTARVSGRGRAVLQLSQLYPTQLVRAAPVTAYQLELRVTPQLELTSCQTWLCPDLTGYSGPASLAVTLPTGYSLAPGLATEDMEEVADWQISNNTVHLHYNYVSSARQGRLYIIFTYYLFPAHVQCAVRDPAPAAAVPGVPRPGRGEGAAGLRPRAGELRRGHDRAPARPGPQPAQHLRLWL